MAKKKLSARGQQRRAWIRQGLCGNCGKRPRWKNERGKLLCVPKVVLPRVSQGSREKGRQAMRLYIDHRLPGRSTVAWVSHSIPAGLFTQATTDQI